MDHVRPEIREFYNNYEPPRFVQKTVHGLLDSVPDRFVQGIECIVLTNQSGHPRRHRLGKISSRKRRIPQSSALGVYRPAYRGGRAWIELFIDNLTKRYPPWVLWLPLMRDTIYGDVLFHEIGHHLHATIAPEFKEKEDVADDWKRKLRTTFLRRKYWFLIPFAKPIRWLLLACSARFRAAERSSSKH